MHNYSGGVDQQLGVEDYLDDTSEANHPYPSTQSSLIPAHAYHLLICVFGMSILLTKDACKSDYEVVQECCDGGHCP